MPVKTKVVGAIFNRLSEEFGVEMNHDGFGTLSEKIDSLAISQRYLYDLWREYEKAEETAAEQMPGNKRMLGLILKSVDPPIKLHQFVMQMKKPLPDLLKHCIGHWWSIVRANEGKYLFKAPVHIYRDSDSGEVLIMLKGKEHEFIGKIHVRAGCLFCELDSRSDKKLYIVLKGGNIKGLELMQGIYTGVSTAGNPIGGRELFRKEHKMEYSEMKWQKLELNNNDEDKRINSYFDDESHPIIGIKKVSAYDLSDLD